MSRVDYKLVATCVASTVLCSIVGGFAIPLAGSGWAGVALVAGCAAACAAVLNLVGQSRRSADRAELVDVVANAVAGEDAGPDALRAVALGDPGLARLAEALNTQQTRLREETAARRVGVARSREMLSVLESLSDPVLVFDRFGAIRLANPAARSLVLGAEPLEGADVRTLFETGPLRELLDGGIRQGGFESRAVEVEHHAPDLVSEDPSVYDARLIPIGEDGTGPFLLAMRDLTRERQISRMKSDFVSKASHELRTPLASIRGYLEMLVDGEADDADTREQFMSSMLDDTERLTTLVENMLNISRIEAGIVRPRLSRSDLGEIAEQTRRMLEPVAAEKGIAISVAPAPVDLSVEGDPTMLHEVVVNLVSNAIKYTPDGGRVSISIDTDSLERSVLVAVADTGMGIPPEAREQVFEKFFRIPSYERMAPGTGLGLNLCRNIVESVHRGRIGVDSTLGEGSRFWFSIPMGFAGARAA